MRVETKTVTYYTLAELKEHHPNGYERALDKLRTSLWEDGQRESVSEDITYEFGQRVGDTTVERYGTGDYPGVDGVELKGWDLERGSYVAFAGTLTPENSPALPWHDWLEQVDLRAGRSYTENNVVDSENAPYIPWNKRETDYDEDQRALVQIRDAMRDAIDAALSEALASGQRAAEHLESEENLLELAQANEWEFDEHGAWA